MGRNTWGMIPGRYFVQPPAPFPAADDSVSFGWDFFKANYFKIAVIDVVPVLGGLLIVAAMSLFSDDPPVLIALAAWVLAQALVLFAVVASLRRGLDFWDEWSRLHTPRDFSSGVGHAFEVAVRRFWPSLGANIFVAIAWFVAYFPFRLVRSADLSNGLRLGLSVLALAVSIAMTVLLSFVPFAAADGINDAVSRAWYIGWSKFWAIFETFFTLALAMAIPFVGYVIFVRVVPVGWIVWIAYHVLLIGAQAFGIGTVVSMYRSQVPPTGDSPTLGRDGTSTNPQ